MSRLSRTAALVAPLLALAFRHEVSAGDDAAMEELRKRFFENEAWYGQATASIHGQGSETSGSGGRSYSIRREAEVQFRVKFTNHGLGGKDLEKTMEMALAHSSPDDRAALQKAFEEMRSQRLWITETSNRKPEDLDDVHLLVSDRTDNWGEEACGQDLPYHDSSSATGEDTRRDECVDMLEIDLAKLTYDPRLDQKVDILKVTRSSSHSGGENANSSKGSVLPESATKLPSLLSEKRALPGQGVLSGSEPISKNDLPLRVDYGTLEGTISWVISPVPFEDVELVLKPQGYDNWRPRPGADEKTAGNSIQVQAVLQLRGGGTPKTKMKSLVVRLHDVSREPGICINWPTQNGARSPDLMMEAARNTGPGVTVDGEGTRLRRKGGEFEDQLVEVSAFDGGAWGEVIAEASLTDGRTVFAILDGHPDKHSVLLPKRSPDSHIADIWKSNRNQAGKKDDADDDALPKGDGQTGDGLANYEEYRGFREKQVWKEADPEKKDFFIRNEAGGVADAGINLFEKISELAVHHRLDAGELSEKRVVNFNHERGAHIVEQHGVRIVNAPALGAYCQAISLSGTGPGTPKDIRFVGLGAVPTRAIDVVTNGVVSRSTYDAPTIAHELLHCCNVYHHGEDPASTDQGVLWTKESDGIYEGGRRIRVLDSSGADIASQVTFQRSWWRREKVVYLYSWQGAASGDVGCVMRYDVALAYTPQGAPDDRVLLRMGEEAVGGGLCTSAAATGTNLTPGRFGPCAAGRGNCKGQILVNDAKTAPTR